MDTQHAPDATGPATTGLATTGLATTGLAELTAPGLAAEVRESALLLGLLLVVVGLAAGFASMLLLLD